jgi:hypothetical protein
MSPLKALGKDNKSLSQKIFEKAMKKKLKPLRSGSFFRRRTLLREFLQQALKKSMDVAKGPFKVLDAFI